MQVYETPKKGLHVYKRLIGYTLRYKLVFFFAIFAMSIFAVTDTAFAALIKPLLDGSFIEKDPETIRNFPLILIGLFFARSVAGFSSTYGMAWVGRNVVKNIRNEMFDKLVHTPTRTYDSSSSGELISKLTYDTEQVAEAATKAITVIIRDGLTIVGLLGLMFYHSWQLALGLLIIGPLIALFVKFMSTKFRDVSKDIQKSMGFITHVVEELIQGHRVVKIFSGEKSEKRSFESVNENNRNKHMKLAFLQGTSIPLVQFIMALFLSGLIYIVTSQEFLGAISVGTFMSFVTAMILMFAPLKRLAEINVVLQRGIAASESIFDLIDSSIEKDTIDVGTKFDKKYLDGFSEINFKNIYFSYGNDEETVLKNISFSVKKGSTCAIVGKSGGGKSTLMNLIPRFYDIFSGEILIGDSNIKKYTLADLRSLIAYVGQDLTLFNDTVKNNIAYGALETKTFEQIKSAAVSANANEFIDKFSNGYETIVGDNGVLLSGGQRQRIAIARAILKESPILLLDEATSSLDSESEKSIQKAIAVLLKNRTTIVIAHRLSTIENADEILVLDKGQIIERGKHLELLSRDGLYANLHKIQFPPL